MPRMARAIPPPLELRCLTAIWRLGEANVQAVRDWLAQERPLAYTTVMTMLERLTRKGILTRRKSGRSFFYKPCVTEDEIRSLAVGELVDALFDGRKEALVAFLVAAQPSAVSASTQPQPEEETQPLDAALL